MKFAIFALAAAVFAAGAASASDKVTDVDFLKANRCKGLATTLTGVVDTASLDSFIKAERGARAPYVMERAAEEFAKAKKEAKGEDRKDRLTAELTGGCQAYLAPASNVAKQ
jgi:regulator of protease activity HflC (stomatin/prohibitin superfamily)